MLFSCLTNNNPGDIGVNLEPFPRPRNTHGGQLSHGRTHGLGLVHEAVTQLRGAAGARQVPGAAVAVVSTGGLTTSGVMLLRSAL
jgi:hypothetical protein